MNLNHRRIFAGMIAAALLLIGSTAQAVSEKMNYIGLDAAKAQALNASGFSSSEAEFTSESLLTRNGLDYYALTLTYGGKDYEYDIDALTGIIIESRTPALSPTAEPTAESLSTEADAESSAPAEKAAGSKPGRRSTSSTTAANNSGNVISAEEAKNAALEHAGLSTGEVTFVKQKLGKENGRQVYDIEFYTDDYTEYDYEIDASNGAVLSYDYEAKGKTASTSKSGTISADEAKAIALSQVPGADASNIREFKQERDDGRLQYEGEIIYNGMEYEFEIDAYSGAIRSWEAESIRN